MDRTELEWTGPGRSVRKRRKGKERREKRVLLRRGVLVYCTIQ